MGNVKNTILVFGGPGRTGRFVIQNAIYEGFKVKAFVRSKVKLNKLIKINSPHLEIIEGDLLY